MQTDEPGIYAIGDIVAGYPATGACRGRWKAWWRWPRLPESQRKPINPLRIPNCTYCRSADRQRGLTEAKAREKGYNVKVGKFPSPRNSRASIVGAHEGFIKLVSDAKYGEILGVHIIGPNATELIAESVAAMELEATVEDLMYTIHAHPTLSEGMRDAWRACTAWRLICKSEPRIWQPDHTVKIEKISEYPFNPWLRFL